MIALTRFVFAASLCVSVLSAAPRSASARASAPLYPDLRMVVPKHLQLMNAQQREILRFTSGLANTGAGPWALRPVFFAATTDARQEIRDAAGNVVIDHPAGVYEFHPTHNHWHIGEVALFEVRAGGPTGTVVGSNTVKVGFCLIDWYKLDDNAPGWERTFFDCETSYQGVSPGWVDQYHHSVDGQQLDLTGVPNGEYYFVATINPALRFLEQDTTNNTEWVKFRLYSNGQGNRKIEELGHSPCESPGLCGENPSNR
jgi:hypothetical protein